MFDMDRAFANAQGHCDDCKKLHIVGNAGNPKRKSYWSKKRHTTIFVCANCVDTHEVQE